MKSILRTILFYGIALYIVSQIFRGLKITGGIKTIVIGGAIFALLSLVLRPILKIISLPFTVVTFGLFSFLLNAVILYILTIFVPEIQVHSFTLEKMRFEGFSLPQVSLNSIFAFVFLSAIIGILVWFLDFLTE